MVDTFGIAAGAGLQAKQARQDRALQSRRVGLDERRLGIEEENADRQRKQKLREEVQKEVDNFTKMAQDLKRIGTPEAQEQIAQIKQMMEQTLMAAEFAGVADPQLALRRFDSQVAGTPTLEQEAVIKGKTQVAGATAQRDALQDAGVAPADAAQTAFKIQQAPLTIDAEVEKARKIAFAQAQARQSVQPAAGFSSDLGKLIEDQALASRMFGADSPQAEAFSEAVKAEQVGEEPKLTDIRGVRQEYTKLSGPFITVRDAFNTVKASAADPSAAGDLSLVFAFMKMLDPGSTVREGEFATAQKAAGVPERIRTIYNQILDGDGLGPDQRPDFVDRANRLFAARQETQQQLEASFTELSTSLGLDPAEVVIPFGSDEQVPAARQPANSAQIGGKPISEMTEAEANQIPIDGLTAEQKQALLDRFDELENANAK